MGVEVKRPRLPEESECNLAGLRQYGPGAHRCYDDTGESDESPAPSDIYLRQLPGRARRPSAVRCHGGFLLFATTSAYRAHRVPGSKLGRRFLYGLAHTSHWVSLVASDSMNSRTMVIWLCCEMNS